MLTFFSFKWFLIYLITTLDIFLNQTHFARLGIFHLELGKKHAFWLWEWGRISAPNFGDREPCIYDFIQNQVINMTFVAMTMLNPWWPEALKLIVYHHKDV